MEMNEGRRTAIEPPAAHLLQAVIPADLPKKGLQLVQGAVACVPHLNIIRQGDVRFAYRITRICCPNIASFIL